MGKPVNLKIHHCFTISISNNSNNSKQAQLHNKVSHLIANLGVTGLYHILHLSHMTGDLTRDKFLHIPFSADSRRAVVITRKGMHP